MDRRQWKEPVDEQIVVEGMSLEQRALMRIRDGAQLVVTVESGTLWITEEGNAGDFIVTPGRWHRVQGDGLVIALALQPSVVTVSAPFAAAARWQLSTPH
jgi:hypothetical protein